MFAKPRGFILMTVLLFLAIFSLWTFYALETDVLENTFSDQYWHRSIIQNSADALLAKIEENSLDNLTACLIPKTDSHTFIMKTEDAWRNPSCAGIFNAFQYYYGIESLVTDDCSYIEQQTPQGSKKIRAIHYRVTLYLINPQNEKERVLVQSVLAFPHDKESVCLTPKHTVCIGRQSWRELI